MTRFPTPHIPVLFSLLDRVHGKLLNKYILNPTHNRQDRHVLCPHKAEETDNWMVRAQTGQFRMLQIIITHHLCIRHMESDRNAHCRKWKHTLIIPETALPFRQHHTCKQCPASHIWAGGFLSGSRCLTNPPSPFHQF